MSKAMQAERKMWSKVYTYDEWMEAQGIPIYRGYYIEDLRTLELGWWEPRAVSIPLSFSSWARKALRRRASPRFLPAKLCRRLSLPWTKSFTSSKGVASRPFGPEKSGQRKLSNGKNTACFLLPHNYTHQFSNMQGDKPVRLLHYNYMPLTLVRRARCQFHLRQLLRRTGYSERDGFLLRSENDLTTKSGRVLGPARLLVRQFFSRHARLGQAR